MLISVITNIVIINKTNVTKHEFIYILIICFGIKGYSDF